MSQVSTVSTVAKIDVGPSGVTITFEQLDNNIASLILEALTFTTDPLVYHTVDTSDVVIKSDKIIQFITPPVSP